MLEKEGFYKTHIEGFDKLLEEGIPNGTSVIVEGGPGSGKTIFCLQTAYNACMNGKKALYMSFEEPEFRLRHHMKKFGFKNAEKFEREGKLQIRRFSAIDIAKSVEALLTEAKKELLIDVEPILIPQDFQPDVVIMDSLTSIASAFSGKKYRFRIYMEQLFRYLERNNINSFLIVETPYPTHTGAIALKETEAVSFLSDGIIAIYNVFYKDKHRERSIEIVKMRGVNFRRQIVKMEITNKGMIVYPDKTLKGDFLLT